MGIHLNILNQPNQHSNSSPSPSAAASAEGSPVSEDEGYGTCKALQEKPFHWMSLVATHQAQNQSSFHLKNCMSSYYKIHQNICQNTIPKFMPAHSSTANHQLHHCTHRNLCGLRVHPIIPHPRRLRIGRGRRRGTTPTVGGRGWGGGPRCRRGRGGGMPLPECHPSHLGFGAVGKIWNVKLRENILRAHDFLEDHAYGKWPVTIVSSCKGPVEACSRGLGQATNLASYGLAAHCTFTGLARSMYAYCSNQYIAICPKFQIMT